MGACRKKVSFSLFNKRERWGLTLLGWGAVVVIALGVPIALLPGVHTFLAIQDRVQGDTLVVEGWIPDSTIPGAVDEFRANDYRVMIVIGGPILLGGRLSSYKSYSEVTQARLKELGVDQDKIVVLETSDVRKDRTYQSAQAVKKWLASSRMNARGINVYTLGVHARRSRLLFNKALGSDYSVGVIAAPDLSYDPDYWWESSSGFRRVMDELIAYVYAVVLFHP